MDPICHTLVGTTLAQAGLKRRSRLAAAALVIGANLPDVDGITYLLGDSLLWRRGWTHGLLALAIWPFVLTGVLMAWDRIVAPRPGRTRAAPRELLWLSALALATHPTLDFMNNYGMRWLMPFANRWFYGDALFIVDPWLWLLLAAGTLASWWLSRGPARAQRWTRPARWALGVAVVYILVMAGLAQAGRGIAREQFASRGRILAAPPMVAPVFADVTRRYVVADDGSRYYVTGFTWWPSPALDRSDRVIAHDNAHPAIAEARTLPDVRHFLQWARFPYFSVEDEGTSYLVTVEDARYAPVMGRSWAATQARVPKVRARGALPAPLPVSSHPQERRVSRILLAIASWCAPRSS